jgi:glycosyltransferase involved in cell wall biosynthesis
MSGRILHLLSQRPLLTGSGITLDALVTNATAAGWKQRVLVGVPGDRIPAGVGGLAGDAVACVTFKAVDGQAAGAAAVPDATDLDFALPGMSDVMPYASSRFSELAPAQLAAYRDAWREAIRKQLEDFSPDLVHAHHAWIVASLVKDVAPSLPVVMHAHGTCLRQMSLCPGLADSLRSSLARNERLLVLQQQQSGEYQRALGFAPGRVGVVGAGYNDGLFNLQGREPDPGPVLLYAGKLAAAKGLPQLLDAVELLATRVPGLLLQVAGGGQGREADALRQRMKEMSPLVSFHGRLDQAELAALMRRAAVFVLPSFYEGLPLVLAEALACGCRLVATDLPGLREAMAARLGEALALLPAPAMKAVDTPREDALPAFVGALTDTLEAGLAAGALKTETLADSLASFSWKAVFERVQSVWIEASEAAGR